jgi:hypothetical protein
MIAMSTLLARLDAFEWRGQAKRTNSGPDAAAAAATVHGLVSKGWRQVR